MTLKASFPVDGVKKMENKRQDSMELFQSKTTVTDIQVAAGVWSAVSFHYRLWSPSVAFLPGGFISLTLEHYSMNLQTGQILNCRLYSLEL